MASKSADLAARREALVSRCADQRTQVAYDFAMLSSPQTLGLIPAYAARHKKMALIVAGIAAGLALAKPKWMVGSATAVVSAYKLAQKLLPVLRWKGFEVH
ncbi:hypothetical protein IM543_05485 [Massilia sp. UMI-21]|nr:hypothetical protein IM543_05485 [Massilia sp. UMI-21]